MIIENNELVAVANSIPLPIFQSYFNKHKEEAFYFTGDLSQMQNIRQYIQTKTNLKNVSRRASLDTYYTFQKNNITDNVSNLRIRQYNEEEKRLLDLIFLFKSNPGDENVYVVRFNSNDINVEKKIIQKNLSKHFALDEAFQIEKVSREIWPEQIVDNDRSNTKEYLNVSFDEISFLHINSEKRSPLDVSESDKIIEIEYNDQTNPEHLANVKNILINNLDFKKYTKPKYEKKSEIIDKYLSLTKK